MASLFSDVYHRQSLESLKAENQALKEKNSALETQNKEKAKEIKLLKKRLSRLKKQKNKAISKRFEENKIKTTADRIRSWITPTGPAEK